MWDVESIGAEFSKVQPLFERLGRRVRELFEGDAKSSGIKAAITDRPKDVDSFVKKAIRKNYDDPMDQIRDKAGVRAIVVYQDDVSRVRDLIKDRFVVLHEEDKVAELGSTKLGYQGVHFEVMLKPGDLGEDHDLADLICEIQIHTRAQSAWAEVSHELVYKALPAPGPETERRVMLLQALMELFDREVGEIRIELLEASERKAARLLAVLEPHFLRLSGSLYDQELSMRVLDVVANLYEDESFGATEERLGTFITKNEQKLKQLFAGYREGGTGSNPLLLQPESMTIFERLEQDRFSVLDQWGESFDIRLLKRLADAWGIPLPENA